MTNNIHQICDCALIIMSPADVGQLEYASDDYKKLWAEAKLKSGSRTIIADALCKSCNGSGMKTEEPKAQAAQPVEEIIVAQLAASLWVTKGEVFFTMSDVKNHIEDFYPHCTAVYRSATEGEIAYWNSKTGQTKLSDALVKRMH